MPIGYFLSAMESGSFISVIYPLRCCLIVLCVPLGEGAEALAERGGGAETEVLFEGSGVGKGDGYVARLHGDEFLVCFKVVVGGKHFGGDEFLLQDGDEVKKVLGRAVADVVYFIGRNRQAVLAVLSFRCVLHDADDAFHDVIDEGEVALAVAVVEDLDGFAGAELVGKTEVGHVWTSGGAIDGEEAQTSGGDIVEFAVGVCQQFVALLRCGVEADGVVNLVVG